LTRRYPVHRLIDRAELLIAADFLDLVSALLVHLEHYEMRQQVQQARRLAQAPQVFCQVVRELVTVARPSVGPWSIELRGRTRRAVKRRHAIGDEVEGVGVKQPG